MLPIGYEWDQADLGEGLSSLNQGMISIIAFDPGRSPKLIGTAFIVGAFGENALAITAAHNFKGIRDIQKPHRHHHPSALPEFLEDMDEIDIDRTRLRAICCDRQEIEIAPIVWAAWDKKTDIGWFYLTTQNSGTKFFDSAFKLTDIQPQVGEEVALLGYANMEITHEAQNGAGHETFSMERNLILRSGRVTAIYPDGHYLCKGICVETSIPVFAGMSGGPVFRMGKAGEAILPFGIISSDPDADEQVKNSPQICGNSIIALLGTKLIQESKLAVLKLNTAYIQIDKQSTTAR